MENHLSGFRSIPSWFIQSDWLGHGESVNNMADSGEVRILSVSVPDEEDEWVSSSAERCPAAMFSQEAVPLESEGRVGCSGRWWRGEQRGESGPGGRCHDDDMGLDRWGAANDE